MARKRNGDVMAADGEAGNGNGIGNGRKRRPAAESDPDVDERSSTAAALTELTASVESISKDVGHAVVISDAVADKLSEASRAQLKPFGPHKLKGKDQPVETFGV